MLSVEDHLRRLNLINDIKKVFKEDYEWYQLLEVIKKNSIQFSENVNGCFIDLGTVSNEVIDELEKIYKMCEYKYQRSKQIKESIKEARNSSSL